MIVGFTGTQYQRYLTVERLGRLRAVLEGLGPSILHHGDCIGADIEAHQAAEELGWEIVIHPPENGAKRAFCRALGAVVLDPDEYLARNAAIVRACAHLVAMPKRLGHEELRSGTWATIRRAQRLGRPVTFV